MSTHVMNEYAMSLCNEGIRYIAIQSYSIFIIDENTKIEPITTLRGRWGVMLYYLFFFIIIFFPLCVCSS
jgi:hypothetical protein